MRSIARAEDSEIANGLTGDWDKAERGLAVLSRNIHNEMGRQTRKAGIIAASEVKKYIRSQPHDWIRLSSQTVDRKGSSKMLIDHGDLINSITYKVAGPDTVFVGVLRTARRKDTSQPLVNIARVHEFGFYGMVRNPQTGTLYLQRIPARPYLRPVVRLIEPTLCKQWISGVRQVIIDTF